MELIRVFSKKRLLVLLVLLVINGIFFYKESTDLKTYRIYNDLIFDFILEFNNQNQDAAVTKTAANLAVKEYVSKNKGINKEDEFKAAKEMFLEKVEYIRTYSDKKDEQIKKSKAMLSSSIFSDKDSFSYLNIIKTREDLIKIKDEKVTVSNGVWLEKIANYKFVYYVIIIALSVIIYSFLEERKTGIIYTQYAAANGRGKLFLRRCGILLLSSIVITAVCFLEISIISLKLYGGIEGILDSVCSDEVFAMGSMGLSRAMWLLVNSICVALSIFAVSLLIWGIISSFHNSNIGLCFTVILCAIGVLIGRIVTAKSLFRFFKYFNIEYLIDGSKSWFTYNNWGYDKFIIGVGESTFILMIFVIIVASIILIKNCVLSNPASKIGIIEKMFMKLYELMMSILSKLPMTILEFFKVTVSQRGGIIVIITVFLFVNMNVGYPIRYGLIEVAMAGFCDEHKGASGDELLTIKENLLLELKSYENDPDAGTKIAVANKKLDLINYLIEKTEEGVDVSLINNYEYET